MSYLATILKKGLWKTKGTSAPSSSFPRAHAHAHLMRVGRNYPAAGSSVGGWRDFNQCQRNVSQFTSSEYRVCQENRKGPEQASRKSSTDARPFRSSKKPNYLRIVIYSAWGKVSWKCLQYCAVKTNLTPIKTKPNKAKNVVKLPKARQCQNKQIALGNCVVLICLSSSLFDFRDERCRKMSQIFTKSRNINEVIGKIFNQ